MEDYSGAYCARAADVNVLLAVHQRRTVAAAHLGGIVIECRLKAMLLTYHAIDCWEQNGARKGDPYFGSPITRPGHSLVSILRMARALYLKAKADFLFLSHLNRLMHPRGAEESDFIDLRYTSRELSTPEYEDWNESYKYVVSWLQKNQGAIL